MFYHLISMQAPKPVRDDMVTSRKVTFVKINHAYSENIILIITIIIV